MTWDWSSFVVGVVAGVLFMLVVFGVCLLFLYVGFLKGEDFYDPVVDDPSDEPDKTVKDGFPEVDPRLFEALSHVKESPSD